MSKYTLDCIKLNYFLKTFSEEHTLKSPSNKIEQRYTHRTTMQAECITIPFHYFKNYTPIFEHGFFFYKKNIHSGTLPPPP